MNDVTSINHPKILNASGYLEKSEYKKLRKERYSSFDSGKGKQFEQGKLTLEQLKALAHTIAEPDMISGKQEYYENLINKYI